MSFSQQLRGIFLPEEQQLVTPEGCQRLDHLVQISPLYKNFLSQNPRYWLWLEESHNLKKSYSFSTFESRWKETPITTLDWAEHLRHFRRKMSLKIAYREVNELTDLVDSAKEISSLARFCVQEVYNRTFESLYTKWGLPWTESNNKQNRFCVLALGKLGGNELNFCSDIDLIYLYESEGFCKKNDKITGTSNQEFFSNLSRNITRTLNKRTAEGFLFNTDTRLRPGGENAPIAINISRANKHYWNIGQTWERLALIKADFLVGDRSLAEEFLNEIMPFCYPRFASTSLLQEITTLKERIHANASEKNDIKKGQGGIREIEFLAQSLQLLNAGKNPFLQTKNTLEALSSLNRYKLIDSEDCKKLSQAYIFLRTLENRIQIQNENQTHSLPKNCTTISKSLGFNTEKDLHLKLNQVKKTVSKRYNELFKAKANDCKPSAWAQFLAQAKPQFPEQKISIPNVSPKQFQNFILGEHQNQTNDEQAHICSKIFKEIAKISQDLTDPKQTLSRLDQLAQSYHARKEFLRICTQAPIFFKNLCFIIDQSSHAFKVLCKYPEIIEELLHENFKRKKDSLEHRNSIKQFRAEKKFDFHLWRYIQAEQTRISTHSTKNPDALREVCRELAALADGALISTLESIDPEQELSVIALGKYGSEEIVIGSDLDIILLCNTSSESVLKKVRKLQETLSPSNWPTPSYQIDLRLRPFGNDSLLTSSLDEFESYHNGHAKLWEKQALTRYRFITGQKSIKEKFEKICEKILYSEAITKNQALEIAQMQKKIQLSKRNNLPIENNFKICDGGIIEFEFFSQTAHLLLGKTNAAFRKKDCVSILKEMLKSGIINKKELSKLIDNFYQLRLIEYFVRKESYQCQDLLPHDITQLEKLAKKLGFNTSKSFREQHSENLKCSHLIIQKALKELL